MKVERKNICKNLPKKGFQVDKNGDHIYFHFYYEGACTGIHTHISHTKKFKDYSTGVLNAIRKQLKLDSNKEAVELINCPMDEERYIEILKSKGFLPAN